MSARENRMTPVLRPMNTGEILDRTFEIYRQRFLLFTGIAALPATAMLGLHFADIAWWHTDRLLGQLDRGESVAWNWAVAFAYSHISGFLAVLFGPAFVQAGSNTLFGESVSIGGSLRFAAARWRTYLWIAFLKLGAELIGPEISAVGIVVGTAFVLDKLNMLDDSFLMGAVVLLAAAGLIFMILWVGACMSLAVPAASLEGLGGVKAVRRSWTLTKGSRWRILLTWFAILICSLVLQGGIQFVVRWITILLYRTVHYAGFNRSVYAGLIFFFYAVVHAVIGPLYPLAITLFYYDQRVRKEGYDLEKMIEAAGWEIHAGEPAAGALTSGQILDLTEDPGPDTGPL
jgi:hypothetical protein